MSQNGRFAHDVGQSTPCNICTLINLASCAKWPASAGGHHGALVTGLIDVATPPCPDYADQLNAQRQVRDHIHELRGRDLACPCKPGAPCHADVLLELANR